MTDLSTRYWGSFFFASLVCFVLQMIARNPSKTLSASSNSRFTSFQLVYLVVFLLAMFSDWLQGPYVYELYASYGFSQDQIAELFVCGFASSMFLGTFIGGLADTLGRRNMCITYSITYILACFTKMVPDYSTLMLGRFLSGVSTSLLFSAFESWMVCEHNKQGFDPALLGDTFAYATFGNGMVAVLAGLAANTVADAYGFVAPFVLAIAPLSLVAILVSLFWNENYGNQQLNMCSSLAKGVDLIRNDSRIAALGLAQSCFEGAMYTFVFMWTPALKDPNEAANAKSSGGVTETTSQYLGLIFAVYMVCTMVGSSVFKLISPRRENIYKIPIMLHSLAFLSMITISMCLDNKEVVYFMFLLFETCVGLFYPSYGMIKSEKIPEDIRSAVMCIFRIPLNAFVVLLLLKIKYLSSQLVFITCSCAHAVSLASYLYFYYNTRGLEKLEDRSEEDSSLLSKNGTV